MHTAGETLVSNPWQPRLDLAVDVIGWAVRLAQELGMEEVVFQLPAVANTPDGWKQDRILKSYIYCYNAEQQ